mgnify:CR=1 FL=1
MGQKINPIGFRLSLQRNWISRWYANDKNFPSLLTEDIKIRKLIKKKLHHASVSKVIIERPAKNARITILSSRPGLIIGKKGEDIEKAIRKAAVSKINPLDYKKITYPFNAFGIGTNEQGNANIYSQLKKRNNNVLFKKLVLFAMMNYSSQTSET